MVIELKNLFKFFICGFFADKFSSKWEVIIQRTLNVRSMICVIYDSFSLFDLLSGFQSGMKTSV